MMKNKILLITAILFLSVLLLNAQEKKKIQVKVLKSESDETITIDTTFASVYGDVYFYSDGEVNKEKIDSILESLDIEIGSRGIKFISKDLDDIDSEKIKHIWISATDDDFDLDKHAIIELIDGEKIIETTDEYTITSDDSLRIKREYIYVVGDEKVYETKKDGKKVLISKSAHSESYVWNTNEGDSDVKIITISGDVDITNKDHVKVISTANDSNEAISEIVISNCDDDTKTIEIFVSDDEFDDDNMMVELEKSLEGSGENVKIVKYKTDEGKYVIKAEITDDELEVKDGKKIKKIKIVQGKEKGIFDIEFKLDKKDTVILKVEDVDGKKVYLKKIKKFNGSYSGEIDISGEQDGMYFIKIIQNDKTIIENEIEK